MNLLHKLKEVSIVGLGYIIMMSLHIDGQNNGTSFLYKLLLVSTRKILYWSGAWHKEYKVIDEYKPSRLRLYTYTYTYQATL